MMFTCPFQTVVVDTAVRLYLRYLSLMDPQQTFSSFQNHLLAFVLLWDTAIVAAKSRHLENVANAEDGLSVSLPD